MIGVLFMFRVMLPAGFSIGSSHAKEAALRRVLRMLGELRCRPPEEIARPGSGPGGGSVQNSLHGRTHAGC